MPRSVGPRAGCSGEGRPPQTSRAGAQLSGGLGSDADSMYGTLGKSITSLGLCFLLCKMDSYPYLPGYSEDSKQSVFIH